MLSCESFSGGLLQNGSFKFCFSVYARQYRSLKSAKLVDEKNTLSSQSLLLFVVSRIENLSRTARGITLKLLFCALSSFCNSFSIPTGTGLQRETFSQSAFLSIFLLQSCGGGCEPQCQTASPQLVCFYLCSIDRYLQWQHTINPHHLLFFFLVGCWLDAIMVLLLDLYLLTKFI